MPKPDKWNIAHAERERRKAMQEKKVAMTTSVPAITFSDLGAMIRQTEQFQEMQKVLDGGYSGMGIGYGVFDVAGSPSVYIGETVGEYYPSAGAAGGGGGGVTYKVSGSYAETVAEPYYYISRVEHEALLGSLAEANALLAERDEIIEALSADLGEIDSLREENARLKAGAGLGQLTAGPTTSADGWVEWPGEETGTPHPDSMVVIRFRDGAETDTPAPASRYRWNQTGHGARAADIFAYRIIA